MLKYNWMGEFTEVVLTAINPGRVWAINLNKPGQPYCMGTVKKADDGFEGMAKGRSFKAAERVDVIHMVLEFQHEEAKRQKAAFDAVYKQNR
jgi:hypothetical protein